MLSNHNYTTDYIGKLLYTHDPIDPPDAKQANGTLEVLEALYYVRCGGGPEAALKVWESTIKAQRPDVAQMVGLATDEDEDDDLDIDKITNPDDDQLAIQIARMWAGSVGVLYGDWHIWDNGCWRKRQQPEIREHIRISLRRWRRNGVKVSHARIKALAAMLEDDCLIPDRKVIDMAGERARYIPLQNGLFNVETMTLEPHRPELYFRDQLGFDYDPKAQCPAFLRFLNTSLIDPSNNNQPDEEMILFLQEALAYSMTARTDMKASFWLYGKPDSGKSTLLSLIRSLMGNLHGTVDLNTLGGNRFMLSAIVGKRVVTFSEADQGMMLPDGLYKALVGGTDEIFADVKNKPGIVFVPESKLWWGMNNMPRTTDRSGALLNRLYPVLFNRSIPKSERIQNLDRLLAAERSGIFNWLMVGYQRLVAQRQFTECAQATAWKEEYKLANDTELLFVNDACEVGASYRIQSRPLHKAYKAWCEDYGYRHKNEVNAAFEWQRLGFERKRQNGCTFWLGVKLRSDF